MSEAECAAFYGPPDPAGPVPTILLLSITAQGFDAEITRCAVAGDRHAARQAATCRRIIQGLLERVSARQPQAEG